jgi:hypothetical protein
VHSWLWKSLNKQERCYRDVGPEAGLMQQDSAASGYSVVMIRNTSISGSSNPFLFLGRTCPIVRHQRLCDWPLARAGFPNLDPCTPNEITVCTLCHRIICIRKRDCPVVVLRRTHLLLGTFTEALLTRPDLVGFGHLLQHKEI